MINYLCLSLYIFNEQIEAFSLEAFHLVAFFGLTFLPRDGIQPPAQTVVGPTYLPLGRKAVLNLQ